MAITLTAGSRGMLRHSTWDGLLVGLSFVHAAVLIGVPSIAVIGLGLWWNANTISHNFIHLPFFRSRRVNRLYSIYLTALLGIPQSLWRQRHLRHHRGAEPQPNSRPTGFRRRPRGPADAETRWTGAAVVETGVVLVLWAVLAALVPRFFVAVYVPGYLVGLWLCSLQGHFEHARGTTSHYGWLYNFCLFNDGYHSEHHLRSSEHWTRLPRHVLGSGQQSRWPPILRWLDTISVPKLRLKPASDGAILRSGEASLLESLERLVLRSPWLQAFVLAAHERAFRALLARLPSVRRITIVGGGLFPRTALILQHLLPTAALTIVDASARNLEIARPFLDDRVVLSHRSYDLGSSDDAELVVIPLSFVGDRALVYREPQAPATLVHDWIWRKTAEGAPVSWLLLKRLNLVRQDIGRTF